MSTPLTAIGKYTGVLTIFLGVLLMFAFVVADPLMQYAGAGRGGPGGGTSSTELVAKWNGGQVNELQLEQAVIHRNILAEFQLQVRRLGYMDATEDGVEDLALRVQPIELPRSREQGVEASVIRTKIFAEKARDAGMVVNDEMIVDYLRALGRDRVSNQQMREILTRMGRNNRGGRATIGFVFDLLREAMLANNYLASHTYVFRTILPEEKWEDWKKLNERVVVEAAPIDTSAFIDEAPEPTDAELAEFFELYRNRQPSTEVLRGYGNVELPSRLPAFATPPRVKISYLKADFNAELEQLENEITDEQIAEYYEANKESFVAADRALFGDDEDEESMDLEADTEEAADAETESAEEGPAEEPEATEETTTEETAEEESANPLRRNEAVEEEEEEEEESAETTDEEAADETSEPPYQPLEEVADEIRRRLAMQQAADRIREKMDRIKLKLDDEFVVYFDALLDAESKPDAETPEPPKALADLKPLAEAEQLELVELDQASQAELRAQEVGSSVNADRSAQQPLPVWYEAFALKPDGSPEVDPYEPMTTYDIDGNRYLVLITERYEAETPDLDEMREQVVGEWKRLKAAEIALEKAEEIAEELSGSGQSLADYFAQQDEPLVATEKVQETDPFSLFAVGRISPQTGQAQLRLSQPAPLVAPGPELLDGVFDLDAGEVGAELNHNHAIAYLLRISQKIGTEDELRRNFIRDGDRWVGGGSLMQARMQNKLGALLRNLLDESGLEEMRQLDRVR